MIYFAGKIHSTVAPWQRVLRILVPIVLPIFALICQESLWEHIHSQKFLFFYPAVMASGWLAGKRGSLFATVFSAAAVFFFLMELNRLTSTSSHDEYIPLIVFVAIGMLISHYLNVEERVITQLALQTEELEAANQARISFLAHVSHEIRTPLNAILGYAQLLARDVDDPSQRAMTQRIQNAGEYLLSILNKILDFKKIEANLLKLDPQPQDIGELLEEIQHTVLPSADSKGISFHTEVSEVQGQVFLLDSLRLKQILLNLSTNAIKFTSKGKVVLRVRILESSDTKVHLLFEVQDTGIGISKEGLKVLFNPFVQADASIAGRFGGSGLGLSIVKQLVEMMGGRVGVESRLGHGTLFWLEIPFERCCLPVIQTREKPIEKDSYSKRLEGLRVLAADDNPINLDLVAGLIHRQGGSVKTVGDGVQALKILKTDSSSFDVILMDLHMPNMDGIEATREIRANPDLQHIPVVGYSAEAIEITKNADVITLFDGWIEKPIKIDDAIEVLSRFCSASIDHHEHVQISQPIASEASPDSKHPLGPLPDMIDAKRVGVLFGDDLETFFNCFSQFQRVFASAGRDLENAISSDRDVLAKDLLHNIRGSAANIGLSAIAEAAAKIESMMLEARSRTLLDDAVSSFVRALQDVLDFRPTHSRHALHLGKLNDSTVHFDDMTAFAKLLAGSDLEALSMASHLEHQFLNDLGDVALRDLNYALEGLEFDKALKILSCHYGAIFENRRLPEVQSEESS